MTHRRMQRWGCVAILSALVAGAVAGPVIDGQGIPGDFGAGALLATQRFQTQFGDDMSGNQWGNGSELDQLYVTNDGTYLYIGITGNLENNGNAITIFIDVDNGLTGANPLLTQDFGEPVAGLPRFLAGDLGGDPGLNNLEFDSGFAPNFALGITGGSPLGSQTRSYYLVDWVTLADFFGPDPLGHVNEVAGMITAGDATASGAPGTLGSFLQTSNLGILGAADNSNTAGVDGGNGLWTTDPATATTGFEFAIPLSLLGVTTGDEICMVAMVSGTTGWISNQFLPTDDSATTLDNPGLPPFSFADLSGDQFVCYTIAESQGCPNAGGSGNFCTADLSGDCMVDLADLAIMLGNYGTTGGATHDDGDLDGDGDVDLSDLAIMLGQYGDDCN